MSLFHYPKVKHRRHFSPRQFKNYKSYKPVLQAEFARVCVYCRQPDSSAPNLAFSVDHYRPQGIPRFKNLVCAYGNLYYCCRSCNSRKNKYWPENEKKGPYIVAPCEHEMAAHLRFNSGTGQVEPKTLDGSYTEELLQLNDIATVQYRIGALKVVQMCSVGILEQEHQLKAVSRLLREGKISQSQFNVEEQSIRLELQTLRDLLQSTTGEKPLRSLTRVGVSLLMP